MFLSLSPRCQIKAVDGFTGYQGAHRGGERGRTLFEDTFKYVHGFWPEESETQSQWVRDLPIYKDPAWGYPPDLFPKRRG